MKCEPTVLPGVFVLRPDVKPDTRGYFVKLWQTTLFTELGLRAEFRENYCSVSHTNVLRGMHFQVPPADGGKLVCCQSGLVHDALLDLRTGSSAFGRHVLVPLDGNHSEMIYMPPGVAHGFWVEKGPALMHYFQEAEYAPPHDQGLAWNKVNIDWPCRTPIVSVRDAAFDGWDKFHSPFIGGS